MTNAQAALLAAAILIAESRSVTPEQATQSTAARFKAWLDDRDGPAKALEVRHPR